jgi:PAS domain S-box-containing protein
MDDHRKNAYPARDEQNTDILAINERLMISAVRQHEHAEVAKRAEQRLRDLVNGLDVVICEVGIQTGRPTFLSYREETFLGHTLNYWTARPNFLDEIIHSDDRERVAALLPTIVQERQEYEYEFRAVSKDDDIVWLRNIVRRVRDAHGNVDLLRCVIVDVTAQRHVAQELESAYTREHNVTSTLQRSLLFTPPEDAFPGLAIKTFYEPASDEALVGGDFWDIFACDHGHVAIVLGDVAGHGLRAAAYTTELKYSLRGFIREHVHPSRILQQMNAYLCECYRLCEDGLNDGGDDGPLCLMVAIIDTATGHGSVAGAGMEPMLLVRNDGQAEEMLTYGMLLGVRPGEEYDEVNFAMGQGDFLVLATDGLTEARQGDRFLGYSGLTALALEGRSLGSLGEMGAAIMNGTRDYSGGRLKDDACVVLALRR